MSDEEDYLSDKFLVAAVGSSSRPETYTQRRQESLKQSRIKNEQTRPKSRRQREQESREEGLRKSLFERAEEDTEAGKNKALGIMFKMGFKVGESLGQKESVPASEGTPPPTHSGSETRESSEPREQRTISPDSTHRIEPLPVNEWSGKRGIGSGKRTRSPGASNRLAKMAKMAEDASKEDFRAFNRREYEERRAEARLMLAQRTCMSLDETAGITFNVLWINPKDVDSIPKELMDAVSEYTQNSPLVLSRGDDEATRLRDQMRADALQPVASDEDDNTSNNYHEVNKTTRQEDFAVETVEEAVYFSLLRPRDRLSLLLTYLRDQYAYCFWCGTKYEDESNLEKHCPGPNEDDHD